MLNQDTDEPTKSSPDLFRKSVKGGMWVFTLRIATQVLSIGRYILLMNILQVSDMGLLGIAFLMIQTLEVLTATGFNAALIQKKEQIDSYLNSAWTFNIFRAFVLFAILYFGAPVFVKLKEISPERFALTVSVIRVLGFTFIVSAFSNIGIIYFIKELEFHKQFFIQIFPTLISIFTTVVLVLLYKSVWSLVLGRLSAGLFRCVISYFMHPYRPRFELDISKAKELWGFGKWVLGASLIGFIFKNGDDYFVWAYIDAAALGLYQAAYKLSNIPATEITNVISQVSFPAYSKLQDDIPRLRSAYFKILQMSSCLSIPVAVILFVFTKDFVTLFLKPEWHSLIPAMRILVVFGLIRSLAATLGPVFFALSKVEVMAKLNFVKLILMMIILYPLTKRYGIVGTSLAVVSSALAIQPFLQYFGAKLLKYNYLEPLKVVLIPCFATVVMVLAVCFYQIFIPKPSYISFLCMIMVSVVSYILSLIAIDAIVDYGVLKTVREQFEMIKK